MITIEYPEWVKYAAKDENGEVWVYACLPLKKDSVWESGSDFDSAHYIHISDPWEDSLHELIDGEWVEVCQFKMDDPVMVSMHDGGEGQWVPRYFKEYKNGRFVCWKRGSTSWSARGEEAEWKYCRKPTEEELG